VNLEKEGHRQRRSDGKVMRIPWKSTKVYVRLYRKRHWKMEKRIAGVRQYPPGKEWWRE